MPHIRRLTARLLLLALLFGSAPQAQDSMRLTHFDIDAQPLGLALNEFGQQAGLHVVVDSALARGITSPPLRGQYLPDAALKQLLQASGLQFRFVDENTVAVLEPRAQTDTAGAAVRGVQSDSSQIRLAQVSTVAAEQKSKPVQAGQDDAEVQEVIVREKLLNSSRSIDRARSNNDALPFVVISRQELESSSAVDVVQFLRTQSQVSTYTTPAQGLGGNGMTGGNTASISLRGLPSLNTLILINGRPAVRSAMNSGNDVNLEGIPTSAIERIEILPTSASAIYGASAAAGVINIILRENYKNAELGLQYGNSTASDTSFRQISLLKGFTFADNRGALKISLLHNDENGMIQQDRGFYRELMQRTVALTPASIFGATPPGDAPGNIRSVSGASLGIPGSTANYTSVPSGYDGVNRGASAYTSTAGQYKLDAEYATNGRYSVLWPERTSTMADVSSSYQLTPSLKLSGGLTYMHYKKFAERPQTPQTLVVPAANPYNPFGQDVRIAWAPLDVGPMTNTVVGDSYNAQLELSGHLSGEWTWSLNGSYQFSKEPMTVGNYFFNTSELTAALNQTNPALAYNPFADLRTQRPNSAAVLNRLPWRSTYGIEADNTDGGVLFSGPLWSLPAGRVTLATGASYRNESTLRYFYDENNQGVFNLRSDARYYRNSTSVFAELNAPLVRREGLFPAVDVTAAGRYDEYSVFGSTLNPQLALKVSIVEGLAIRASYGRGFVPPGLSQLNQSLFVGTVGATVVLDPKRGNEPLIASTQLLADRNLDLKPERSTTTGIGLLIEPALLPGFSATLDYYDIEKTDVVASPTVATIMSYEADFPELVVRGANLPGDPASYAGVVQSIKILPLNFAGLKTTGFDGRLSYRLPIGGSTLEWTAGGTYVQTFAVQTVVNSPFATKVGMPWDSGNPPLRFRGNAGLNFTHGPLHVGVLARYLDSYVARTPALEGPKIGSSMEWDLYTSYTFESVQGGGLRQALIDNTTVSLAVANLFDREPPFYATQTYSTLNDPRMRYMRLSMTKRF